MAKIKVVKTTKDLSEKAKQLAGRMDELKSEISSYLKFINETKARLEQEAREQEERQRQEELARQREEEARRQREEELMKEQKAKEEQQQSAKPKPRQASKRPAEDVKAGSQQPKAFDQKSNEQPQEPLRTPVVEFKPALDNKGKKRSGKASTDIVGKFLAQPPVFSEKEKTESAKAKDTRYNGDQSRDKKRKSKKDYWEDTDPAILEKFRKSKKAKETKSQQAAPSPERKKAITMGEIITVKELSEKIGIQVSEIIKKLLNLGVIATINKEIDYDTASLIASEFDIELEKKATKTFEQILSDVDEIEDNPEDLRERPPVVTVMGHVDHGKTSLLDAIRNSHVTDQEAGGITQHIGAYTVSYNGKTICFLDTPGHEAFTSMRARGAQVTDIAVLVVAADDGVMPQTIEAINHAKAAKVPIIVAINKMDKPDANPDRIKQQLTEYGLLVEEWGGDTIAVPVSALKKEGIDNLLEMILLVAEMQGIKANPSRLAKGTIIEAQLDKGRGPVATILVQNGTLKVGDSIVAGTAYGRVRAMIDDKGRRVTQAGPSTPVEVLGLSDVPDAGDIMYAVEDDRLAKQVSDERKNRLKEEQAKTTSKASLDELFSQIKEGEVKDLNLIIKADVQGSVEAVKQALERLTNEQVRVRCIHGAVGAITESDVMLATASNAIIIGFNVRPTANAADLADKEKIDIRTYRVIYNAIEDIEAAMKGMLAPEYQEVVIGHAVVRAIFRVSGAGTVAGSYVTDGKIARNAQVRLVRDGVVVFEGKIASLKRFKDDVREVAANYECGIGLENFNDIKEGDVIEAFIQQEIKK